MPILSPIGRKHPRVRALTLAIYLLLIAGAATMVYPFLIMISGSTKSAVDMRDLDVIPRFLREDETLYRKYIEGLFNESLDMYRIAYDRDDRSFEAVEPPPDPNAVLAAEWTRFLETEEPPFYTWALGFMETRASRTVPQNLREFKREMLSRYGRDVSIMNRALGTEFVNWHAFFVLAENYFSRLRTVSDDPFQQAFRAFKAEQPTHHRVYVSIEGFYKTLFLKTQYTRDIAEYNRLHGTEYASYDDVRLTPRVPVQGTPRERRNWETFVRHTLNLLWVRVDPAAEPLYREYLRAKYRDIGTLNRNYGTRYDAFEEIPLIERPPFEGLVLSDWDAFIKGWEDPDTGEEYGPPVEALRIHGLDFMFREYLAGKYGSVDRMNEALGTAFPSYDDVPMPQRDAHYLGFLDARGDLRWEFATRNYKAVFDYLVFHGRGIYVTAVYCTLAVLLALLVNPMAAYAMSRYRMPSSYKLLLFLLLTMAFPPIVTQIPVFLMLRDFGLLNTFAALVLPGMAHGYSIFLLKGFFDSLPRDLYENAQIDGAGEWTMFWTITMSLSKPILAVIALSAFTAAYTNFMFALLICQDERMWTLMVWLYQLQMRSGQAVMYASLIVAAIPTFIIFFFCQNIIMRGIVVPVEK